MRTIQILILAVAAMATGCADAAREESTYAPSARGGGFTGSADAPPGVTLDPMKVVAGRQAATADALASAPSPSASGPSPGAATEMLIRTGRASVEVRDLGQAVGRARQMAGSLGGHVAGTNVQTGRDQVRTATLELRIPSQRFDEAVSGLEPLGKVETVVVDAIDVGEEFVDVSARLANARRLEERLLALLAARSGKLEDILALERELARVREEIERYTARLRYLETRVAMSTLSLTVHEPYPVLAGGRNPLGDALRDAWRNFVGFIAWLIAAMGLLVPLVALLAAGYFATRRVWRARAAQ
jgi:hypothetical protein